MIWPQDLPEAHDLAILHPCLLLFTQPALCFVFVAVSPDIFYNFHFVKAVAMSFDAYIETTIKP